MADYVVDFLLGTGEMKKTLADARRNSQTGGGLGVGGGVGLKVAGMAAVVGILSQMKIVMDTIGFLTSILSTGLAFLISMFVQYITPFFKDPARFLLSLFIDQANMIITVLEFMTNAILGALTFGAVGGFGENKIEFPRFQKEIILTAYDNMKEVIMSSESGVDDIARATLQFATSFVDSFMTNSEYATMIEDSASTNFGKVVNSLDKTGGLADDITSAYDRTKKKLDGLFASFQARTSGLSVSGVSLSSANKSGKSALEITRSYNESLNFRG